MMAGKTGTAQSHTIKSGSRATLHLEWEKRDHAWFVAFAPADAPKYAMSVIVQHGGWGSSSAAPKAREIMRMALLKDPEIQKRIIGVNPADLVDKPLSDVPLPEDDAGAAPPPPDTLPTST